MGSLVNIVSAVDGRRRRQCDNIRERIHLFIYLFAHCFQNSIVIITLLDTRPGIYETMRDSNNVFPFQPLLLFIFTF